MAYQKIQGIYKITNKLNNKCYIGQSVSIFYRWYQHRNKKSNLHLYNSFDKYGINNFTFEIIEVVADRSKLLEREIYWYDYYKPEYNNIRPEYNGKSGMGKAVYQIDMNSLEVIREFPTLSSTYDSCTSVKHAIKQKYAISAGGYYWCYKDEWYEGWKPRNSKAIKHKVAKINKETGDIIKIYDSINQAFKDTGISHISRVCKNQRVSAGGFKWSYVGGNEHVCISPTV